MVQAMPTALVTLGRLPKALTLARLLRRAGYRVIIAEPFAWHIGRASREVDRCYQTPPPNEDAAAYRQRLLEIVTRESVSLIVPVSEEIHHVLPLRYALGKEVTLLGPAWQDYETCADKLQFVHRAQALGLRVPETHPIDTHAADQLTSNSACIYKPRRGCSGFGVTRDVSAAREFGDKEGFIAQAYIEGRVLSSLSLIAGGRVIKTVVYEGKAYAGSVAICFESVAPSPAVAEWIATWSESFDFQGFIALDLIVDTDGKPWGIECNPRLTSGVHFFNGLDDLAHETRPGSSLESSGTSGVRRWQWAYSTLTEAYGELFHGHLRGFFRHLKLLFTTRDCVWSWRDPLPFLLMTPLSLPILWPAISEGISMGEACQRDIAPLWDKGAISGAVGSGS